MTKVGTAKVDEIRVMWISFSCMVFELVQQIASMQECIAYCDYVKRHVSNF